MANNQKGKSGKPVGQQNVLESLRDIGTQALDTIKDEAIRGTNIFDSLLNTPSTPEKKKYSGDLRPGESVSFSQRPEMGRSEKKVSFDRHLLEEEKSQIEQKTQELRMQLHAIIQEVKALAQATQNIAQELKVASMQAPVEPGIYHVIFFEKLFETIRNFKKKIDNAAVWLHSVNKRGQKKNYWASYKKQQSSQLLNPESYSQRNAG
jgi:hypothetical protein